MKVQSMLPGLMTMPQNPVPDRWNRTHYYLPDEQRNKIVAILREAFDKRGYKTRKSTSRCSSRKPKGHVRCSWQILTNSWSAGIAIKFEIFAKNRHSGWNKDTYFREYDDFDKIIDYMDKMPAPKLITKDALPDKVKIGISEPLRVIKDRVERLNQWRSVTVNGVVGLNDDGSISEQKVYDPEETPWFHCHIRTYNEWGYHEIITDGEDFYPLRRQGSKRVTHEVPHDLKNTTAADKELLSMAICTLFQESNEQKGIQ